MKSHEIGQGNEVELPRSDYLVHVRGNPGEEAVLADKMLKAGKTQLAIGKALGLSQPQVSKRLKLLELEPTLLAKLRKGELRPSAGYLLAKLPKSIQKEYAKTKDRITIKELEGRKRNEVISEQLLGLLASPSTVIDYFGPSDAPESLRWLKSPFNSGKIPPTIVIETQRFADLDRALKQALLTNNYKRVVSRLKELGASWV